MSKSYDSTIYGDLRFQFESVEFYLNLTHTFIFVVIKIF